MEIYLRSLPKNRTNRNIILEAERSLEGYHTDMHGREYYYQTNDDILEQIYTDGDGDDVLEWSVSDWCFDSAANRFKVSFVC